MASAKAKGMHSRANARAKALRQAGLSKASLAGVLGYAHGVTSEKVGGILVMGLCRVVGWGGGGGPFSS